ncbi:CLUMA_CG011919, isoform A [Clunio marinus]|uniref:CLUMA_CG011919, isoform A n=1 Tax=Clunio marinus TaxID=568069 RepID=A0A1J1IG61_9DIPT|nr:CLUMA_CG011919, isoform A [Clunio marinus]
MSNQYQQTFTTTDGQNNVTYVTFVHPDDNQVLYCKEQLTPDGEEYYNEDIVEEALDESYIEEEPMDILDNIMIKRERSNSEHHEVTRKLVQVSGKPRGRRRMIPDQTRAIRKARANTNKPYVNAKGQEVKPKEFDDSFECTCPKKCTDPKKLPLKTRRQIFNMFWNIGSYEGRCAFLNSCVNELPKKRTYTKNKEMSRRKMTRKYFLKGVEVCKTTFTKTLMISNSRIDVSLQKMETENFNDERGKKKTANAFSDEKKEKVITHIKSNFVPDASLRGLWSNYQMSHSDDPVSESYYKRIFYENFNLKTKKIVKKKIKYDVETIE